MMISCTSDKEPALVDGDGDGIGDSLDNCPTVQNADQADSDGDGIGDVCELDTDGDGVIDDLDNCSLVENPDQLDSDDDGVGDACESDFDGDGVIDELDNCPAVANPDQEDADEDGVGDACEADSDGDGVIDELDNCPEVANPDQEDADEDGIGDVCEADTDEDGVIDDLDNCPEIANPDQIDIDGDGLGDACDETTTAQDQTNIQSSFDSVLDCARSLTEGVSVDVLLRDFLGLVDGDTLNIDWVETLLDDLENVLDPNALNDAGIDIALLAATYDYDHVTNLWNKTDDQSDRVVLNFPSSPTTTTNNSSLTLENYTDTQIVLDGSTLNLPVTLDLSLVVDGIKLLGLDLGNVNYSSSSDFQIPVAIDISIYVNPYTLSIDFENPTMNEYSLSLDFENDMSSCSFGVDAGLKLDHDDFQNIDFVNVLDATVAVHLNGLTIQSLDGIAEILQITDPTESQINSFVDAEILFGDIKIGDLEFDETNETINIVYKDGSSEDSANYYQSLLDDLEDILSEFIGVGN